MPRAHDLDPPAFPGTYDHVNSGMTLRDWFAGQALTGIMAMNTTHSGERIAAEAYAIAEFMLRKRDK